MKKLRGLNMGKKGIAALELALILPILLILVFGIIDFGRLIQARLIVTNVSREGGSLASRSFKSGEDLLSMLQSSGRPIDLNESGRIHVSRIRAGASTTAPDPVIATQINKGSLGVSSIIYEGSPSYHLGLSVALYNRLVFNPGNQASDIAEIWVVEVYYKYKPITPLPNFIKNILITPGYDDMIIGSKSIF